MKRIKSLDHKDAIQRTVIASIHQPSAEVFQFFDNLCLLSTGKTVYFGPASAAIQENELAPDDGGNGIIPTEEVIQILEVFESLDLTGYDLNVDLLDVHADIALSKHGEVAKVVSEEQLSATEMGQRIKLLQKDREKPWMIQLASVTCISLVAKVEETQVPLLLDLQVEDVKYVFEAKTIQRMELLILSTLNWKMHHVTPLSFLDHIIRRLGLKTHLHWQFLKRCENLLLSLLLGKNCSPFPIALRDIKQHDIIQSMRGILVDWLVEICIM
ncbi:hypothetical protein HN51_049801 [Arachis hypogaea]